MTGLQVPLNLYLLRPGVSPKSAVGAFEVNGDGDDEPWPADVSAVKTWVFEDDQPVRAELPLVPSAALLIRSMPSQPAWLTGLTNSTTGLSLPLAGADLGALFFQPVRNEVLLWSFGNAWNLIDQTQIVPRFGLRVGLNALLTSKSPSNSTTEVGVRGLSSAVRAAVIRSATVQTIRPARPAEIERLDQASDGAKLVELTTHHRTFSRIAAGNSLRFTAPVGSEKDLIRYGMQAIRLHGRGDYQSDPDYSWIDNVLPVGERAEVDAVLDKLWSDTNGGAPPVASLTWPDPQRANGVAPPQSACRWSDESRAGSCFLGVQLLPG